MWNENGMHLFVIGWDERGGSAAALKIGSSIEFQCSMSYVQWRDDSAGCILVGVLGGECRESFAGLKNIPRLRFASMTSSGAEYPRDTQMPASAFQCR